MKYKAYPEYRDSGIEWIGEIPRDWEVKKLKYICSLRNEKTDDAEKDYIALEHIESKTGKLIKKENDEVVPEGESVIFHKNDVLFGKLRPYLAKCLLSTFDGKCSPELLVMKSEPLLNPKFLYYSVLSEWFIDVVNSSAYGTKMPRASWDFIGNMSMLLPSLQEQTAIANFLDQQTTKIESMISAKTKLIEKLKEKRNAIITHAVTKGFDSNAKMKPSGIEWIGDIPEGWEVKKISWLFEFISSGTTPASNDNSYYNGEIPWVNTGDLNDGILMSCNKYITQSALDDYSALKLFDEGTLLIAMYGATIGKLAILSFKATTNQACCALGRPKNMDAKFVFYWLLGMKENIISLAYGGGQPNISQNLIKSLKISIPKNIQDQTIIANYLDQETKRIDCIIAKTQTSIQKLKEYQTALISSAVTGKIDARGE